MAGRTGRAAALVALLAVVAGCTGADPQEQQATPASPSATPTPEARTEPVVVETTLDGEPVELEVGPLAVHGDVTVLRLAARTAPGTLVTAFWDVFESIGSAGPSGVRLVDRAPGEVLVAARTASDAVVMTRPFSPGGEATDAALAAAGEGVEVVYTAFGVPDGEAVDVVLPTGGTVADVPVVDASDAGTLTVPPQELVETAVAQAPSLPLERFTELVGGEVRARETPELVTVDVSSDVLFASGSDALAPASEQALAAVAAQVEEQPGGTLTVVGHTDDVDDDAFNLALSQRRAATVRTRLGQLVDLAPFEVAVEGRGEQEPAVQGQDERARAANRRVQVLLVPSAPAEQEPPPADEDGALPPPTGPSAPGPDGVDVVDGEARFAVRLPEVRRLGSTLAGQLEVTNTGTQDLSLSALATGAWDARGEFDATLQAAATNVTIPVGSTRYYPLDYLRGGSSDRREPLADRIINGIAPGATRIVSVLWPDPGTDSVVVEVAPRQVGGSGLVRAPFRLTDVPVVDG